MSWRHMTHGSLWPSEIEACFLPTFRVHCVHCLPSRELRPTKGQSYLDAAGLRAKGNRRLGRLLLLGGMPFPWLQSWWGWWAGRGRTEGRLHGEQTFGTVLMTTPSPVSTILWFMLRTVEPLRSTMAPWPKSALKAFRLSWLFSVGDTSAELDLEWIFHLWEGWEKYFKSNMSSASAFLSPYLWFCGSTLHTFQNTTWNVSIWEVVTDLQIEPSCISA